MAVGDAGDEHTGRDVVALHVELTHDRTEQLGAAEFLHAIGDPALAPQHPAAPDDEHLERRLEVVLGQPDDVEVLGLGEHHLLGFHGPARGAQLVAQLGGLFVLLAPGRRVHLGFEPAEHLFRVARQEVGHGVDVLPVGLLRDPGDLGHARTRAAADVEVQARPLRARPLIEERVGAGADREHAGERIEGVADRPGVGVGTEVAHLLALGPAQHLRPRPVSPTVSAR